jgi:hypothetical protein
VKWPVAAAERVCKVFAEVIFVGVLFSLRIIGRLPALLRQFDSRYPT